MRYEARAGRWCLTKASDNQGKNLPMTADMEYKSS